MSEITNSDRAARAHEALKRYDTVYGDDDPDAGPLYRLSDLLADLMHLARLEGVDFDGTLNTAVKNFREEVEDDPDFHRKDWDPRRRGGPR